MIKVKYFLLGVLTTITLLGGYAVEKRIERLEAFATFLEQHLVAQ